MPNEQNSSQGRRPHYHRGRRGSDRRAVERRTPPIAAESGGRDHADVDQIMRDIRARISKRHGVDFTPKQIQELASRRLEAILEPRHVKPALMEQMRRAAGEPIEVPAPSGTARAEAAFDEAVLYQSHRGVVRLLRRWLNPILKLFFNPAPLVDALSAQARRNNAAAEREAELYAHQAEWNALHYEVLQRLVIESARATLEAQSLSMRVESLAAKVDFNERRVRGLEQGVYQAKPAGRPPDQASARPPDQPAGDTAAAATPEVGAVAVAAADGTSDGSRRRRRRRRGRRSGAAPADTGFAGSDPARVPVDADTDGEGDSEDTDQGDTDRGEVEDAGSEGRRSTALEPAHSMSLLQPVERHPTTDPPPRHTTEPAAADVAPAPVAPPVQPTPPRDEPVPPAPVDRDPGPPDR